MAFKVIGSLNPHGGPILKTEILGNSISFEVNDATIVDFNGFLGIGVASTLLFGHIVGIVDINGVAPSVNGIGGNFTMELLTASNNSTVAKHSAMVDISKHTLYSVDPDATVGTSAGSNLLGFHTDLATKKTTDESGAVDTTAQYHIWGLDPTDSTNQEVNIYESKLLGA